MESSNPYYEEWKKTTSYSNGFFKVKMSFSNIYVFRNKEKSHSINETWKTSLDVVRQIGKEDLNILKQTNSPTQKL